MDTLDDLSPISDADLIAALRQLLASERHAAARVVAYLAELDRRRLYLALGFTSLFKFCTDALHLSEDATFSDGHRCSETGCLEYHHVVPFAAGGKATVDNIELRCRAHNGYEAERFFGPEVTALFRERAPAYL